MATTEYSEGEIKMITACGCQELIGKMDVFQLYRICVDTVFLHDIQGPHVEALRRAFKAFHECKPYRLTPEFEELIKF